MRVERPRFCMKLILTATAQSASIGFSLRSGSVRATYQGGQDDGVEMEVVRSVVRLEEESCTTDYAGAFAKQPPQLHPIDITNIDHCRTPTSTTHHHVCPTEDNWIAISRPCPAALRFQGHRPIIPHVCDQRAHSPRPQDELRRCARCQAHQRLDPDPRGICRRGNEAQARLQCRHRLPDFVRQSWTGTWSVHMANMSPATSPRFPSVSWMEASPVRV
jgi:hypothetical protein